MGKILITRINSVEIFAEQCEDKVLVPIKPICKAIGVDFKSQFDKVKEDEILGSTMVLSTTVGSDGKDREMVCLPLKFVYGWLFTINPKNVSNEAKEAVIKYKLDCYNALYNHFEGKMKRTIETNEAEIKLLDDLRKAMERKKEASDEIKSLEKQISQLRASRLNPQPSLFDSID